MRRSKNQGRPLLSLTTARFRGEALPPMRSWLKGGGPGIRERTTLFQPFFPYQANDGKPFITSSGPGIFFWHNGERKEGGK